MKIENLSTVQKLTQELEQKNAQLNLLGVASTFVTTAGVTMPVTADTTKAVNRLVFMDLLEQRKEIVDQLTSLGVSIVGENDDELTSQRLADFLSTIFQ